MNEISRLTRLLKVAFAIAVLLPVLYAILSMTGIMNLSLHITNAETRYVCDVVGVMLTLVIVPSSLKLFSKLLSKRVMTEGQLAKAMRHYFRLSMMRLAALFVTASYNIVLYFSEGRENNAGLLCFCICMLAFMFCVPTNAKVKGDLNVSD